MTKVVFEITICFLEMLVFVFYASSFYEKKYKDVRTLVTVFLCYLPQLLGVFLESPPLMLALFTLANIIMFSTLFYCDKKVAFIQSLFLLTILVEAIWITTCILDIIPEAGIMPHECNWFTYLLGVGLEKFIYCCLCVLSALIFSRYKFNSIKVPQYWMLCILPISSIGVLIVLHELTYSAKMNFTLSVMSIIAVVMLIFSNILVLFIYESFEKAVEKRYELDALLQKEEIDRKYLSLLEHNNEALRRFSHNINHHLESIVAIADNPEVTEYVNTVFGEINKFSNTGVTKNKLLDVIFSKYNYLCEKEEIDLKIDTKTGNLSFLEDADLTVLINNLLDNAVEAASKTKGRKIEVTISTDKRKFQVLRILNSCSVRPMYNGFDFLSSKSQGIAHGLGIKSVKIITDKYSGKFDWQYDEEEKTFEIVIIFPNAEKAKK